MPRKITVYDKGGKIPEVKDENGNVTQKAHTVEPGAIEMFAVDAHEAVRNDPARYRLTPWAGMAGSKAAKAKAAADAAEEDTQVGPETSRTSSGPIKAVPVGREDTGGRIPEPPANLAPEAEAEAKAKAATVKADADKGLPTPPVPPPRGSAAPKK